MPAPPFPFFEFFAGGGMARIGLGADWRCAFANEWCPKKAASYQAYFGGNELRIAGVAKLIVDDLPGTPALVWASFPCQDLSLAGNGAGLAGERSGTFKPFWQLMRHAIAAGRIPRIVVLENVTGALTSHGGHDFAAILDALAQAGYRAGALVMDAVKFLPQSRPRLFIVGAHDTVRIPAELVSPHASDSWTPKPLQLAFSRLPERLHERWIWWNLPAPNEPVPPFATMIEDEPSGVEWHSPSETDHIIGLMSPVHLAKLKNAQERGGKEIGAVYRRMRPNGNGRNEQRAEVRFDQISGCLRTPVGGSSRQTVIVVEGAKIRSRLLSPREAARLMGVPEDYPLPANYNEAYHLFGDGLAVPVVRWLSVHLLRRLAAAARL